MKFISGKSTVNVLFFFEHPEEREISLIYDLIMLCCILNVFGSVCPKDKLVVGLVGLS